MFKQREYRVIECANCKRARPVAAKGLCRACYARWKKNGTFELIRRKRSSCKVEGCTRVVISHGMCELHWDRVFKTGDPLKTLRPTDWGDRRKHPLYSRWCGARKDLGVVDSWADFWTFAAEVANGRETGTSRLYKLDETKALGPGNFEWREPLVSFTSEAQYARDHRKANPDYYKDSDLRKHFGITLDQYNEMLEAQGGKCKICGDGPETNPIDKRTGKPRMLVVDHCHSSGRIRGLLCQACNQGIGHLKDSVDRLTAAISYLKEEPNG